MTGWDKEYEKYKHQYQELFDKCMMKEQETNILLSTENSGKDCNSAMKREKSEPER